jgi:hypothetical protein
VGVLDASTSPPKERYAVSKDNIIKLIQPGNRPFGVRRAKAALSSGCKPHPASAPAGSNRSSHGGNEMAEAFD